MANKSQRKAKSYRRGGPEHYAKLARKSVDSRIKRHIEAEILLDAHAIAAPWRKRETDAGYDIFNPEAVVIPPWSSVSVKSGVHIKCPTGYYYDLRGRSSLFGKVQIGHGLIDATYTGEIIVHVQNVTDAPLELKKGDRIAQLVFCPQIHAKFKEVKAFENTGEDRGNAGFGSTGN